MPSLSTLSLLATLTSLIQSSVGSSLLPRQGAAGVTTRYWDCCKPSCSWPNKAAFSSPVKICGKDDGPLTDPNTVSGCDGGPGFQCSNQRAVAKSASLAYGFAAVNGGNEAGTCCACYKLTFTSEAARGQTLVVQVTNIGYDVGATQFDLALPGGGVGMFPQGCRNQYGVQNGWGSNGGYGGVSSEAECNTLPAKLQDGCKFRFQWMKGSNNPSVNYERVACPADLVSKSGCRRDDDGRFPASP
ncbi:glycoside hydrolase family 45 protein [Zymoseptoria brevis]|uniref:Cellulase n=1 Tax=Zymoseptoria brevis TaxID=1047168 RepID=A0A0F4GJ65_9PEZI|nr:glycoside hydrolase family 45 protein [Zymoseptoria brevis]